MSKRDLTFKQRKELLEITADMGIVSVELVRLSSHPLVRFTTGDGLSFTSTIAGSMSDSFRGNRNRRAQIRKVLEKARAGEIRGIKLP